MAFHITGIVLAAGTGSRFDPSGHRFKLTQTLADHQSVIAASCRALHPYVDTLLVVDGERARELDEPLRLLPFAVQRVHSEDARAGMGASLKSAIRTNGATHAWVIGLADMPYVAGSTIKQICAALRDGAPIVRPFYQGQPGHPVGISAALRDDLLDLPDHTGAAALLKRHSSELWRLDVDDPGCIADIDYPSDIR